MEPSEQPSPVPRPREQLPVPLFDGVVLAARGADAHIYLGLRDLCQVLGLNPSSQRRRIAANEDWHLVQFRVLVGNQLRTQDFLLLDDVPLWLMSVQVRRVAPEVRERMGYVKQYLVAAVRSAFAQLAGLPDEPSSQIEDLGELDRISAAFEGLAELRERQAAIEGSQDRARGAFRDLAAAMQELRTRVQELEQQAQNRLTPQQRHTLYRMVHTWGAARAERQAGLTPGTAIRKSWTELNARFAVSTYTDLPAARYDEAVRFIQDQYFALTGETRPVVEQTGMDL